MQVRICRICGNMFKYFNGDVVCSNCKSREESVFEEIRDYLYDNPGTKDTELIEKFDVTRKTIT
nr:MerR family transcriptional regulator [Lachnospiraceae bacterium]